jgi:hypothetical protein
MALSLMIPFSFIVGIYVQHRGRILTFPWTDSGHGGQVPDLDGDEIDGYDEGTTFQSLQSPHRILTLISVIFPVDYKRRGYIVDDVCANRILLLIFD